MATPSSVLSVRIVKASYVLTFGSGGASSMIALELENRLFRLGLKVAASVDHQGQMMRAAGAPKGTVIVASSMSGNNAPLAKALAIAGYYGITRIVMTRPETLVAAEADILLGLDIPEAQTSSGPPPRVTHFWR